MRRFGDEVVLLDIRHFGTGSGFTTRLSYPRVAEALGPVVPGMSSGALRLKLLQSNTIHATPLL